MTPMSYWRSETFLKISNQCAKYKQLQSKHERGIHVTPLIKMKETSALRAVRQILRMFDLDL